MIPELQPGWVVQIRPDTDTVFGGCFLTVESVRPWGVTGYVTVPTKDGAQQAPYRCRHEAYQPVGVAAWITETDAA